MTRTRTLRLMVLTLVASCTSTGCGPKCRNEQESTGNHCCWSAQTWSEERESCVGEPKCPAGLEAKAQTCLGPAPQCPEGMVGIGATTFYVGTDRKEPEWSSARPLRQVSTKAFCIDETEVTVGAYKQCVEAGRCSAPGEHARNFRGVDAACNRLREDRNTHPVNCLDVRAAGAFCRSRGSRLPSHIEWQLAAGRTMGRKYVWGDAEPDARTANLAGADDFDGISRPLYDGRDGWSFTAPVRTFRDDRSAFGIYDLGGNVEEITSTKVERQILACGGRYENYQRWANELRSSSLVDADESAPSLGFRCAR